MCCVSDTSRRGNDVEEEKLSHTKVSGFLFSKHMYIQTYIRAKRDTGTALRKFKKILKMCKLILAEIL